jgi:CobQ/CobB/MinD/ParA nucleotide binding domain
MQTVTFYSYKGGVGRSLIVANVAKYLAQFGLTVVALDFDLEAPGLHHKFGLDGEPIMPQTGIVDYLNGCVGAGDPLRSIAPFALSVAPPVGGRAMITLIPAGSAPEPKYWETLSSIDWHGLLFSEDAPGVALFATLKDRIAEEFSPDYLLIDARTGITEMGGIATTLLADVVVTLSLNTIEHLQGVRSVMRSIQRTRRMNGDDPVQLEVALARLPEMEQQDLRRVPAAALEYLNAEAEDPDDTLSLDQVLVLHSDPSLQMQEHLLIGAEVGPETDVALLSDYLRLFARFIPLASLAPRVKVLVDEAMARLLEDPSSTERSLRVLARYTGHPEALRALIKFYRVRQDHSQMLNASARLWQLTREEDVDLLWTAVQEGFDVAYPFEDSDVPIEFVRELWQVAGADDVPLGLRLAQTLDNFGNEEDAVEVTSVLLEKHPSSPVVAEATLRHMNSAGMAGEATALAESRADDFAGDSDFVSAWAKAAAELGDRTAAMRFLEDPRIDAQVLQSGAPGTLFKLLRTAGRSDEIGGLLNRALQEAIRYRRWEDLFELAEEYARRGMPAQRRFEMEIRRGVPDSADAFLRDVRRQTPGWPGER